MFILFGFIAIYFVKTNPIEYDIKNANNIENSPNQTTELYSTSMHYSRG